MAAQDEEERGGYISFADRFDGGGAGRSGARFEGGGLLSDIANMFATPRKARGADTGQIRPVARPSVEYINAARDRVNAPYSFGRDLLDGGGLGRRATLAEINSGRGFRGGLLSGLANMAGVRPMGANDLALITSYDAARAANAKIRAEMGLLDNPVKEAPSATEELRGLDNAGRLGYDDVDFVRQSEAASAKSVLDDVMNMRTPEEFSAASVIDNVMGLNSKNDLLPTSTADRRVGKQLEQVPFQSTPLNISANTKPFEQQLEEAVGLGKTIEILSGPNAAQVFNEFTASGNQLPPQFSERALNIGVYGDPLGRGTMVAR